MFSGSDVKLQLNVSLGALPNDTSPIARGRHWIEFSVANKEDLETNSTDDEAGGDEEPLLPESEEDIDEPPKDEADETLVRFLEDKLIVLKQESEILRQQQREEDAAFIEGKIKELEVFIRDTKEQLGLLSGDGKGSEDDTEMKEATECKKRELNAGFDTDDGGGEGWLSGGDGNDGEDEDEADGPRDSNRPFKKRGV